MGISFAQDVDAGVPLFQYMKLPSAIGFEDGGGVPPHPLFSGWRREESFHESGGLLSDQGSLADAIALLQPVYARFTEGLDTADLRAANALLKALSVSRVRPA